MNKYMFFLLLQIYNAVSGAAHLTREEQNKKTNETSNNFQDTSTTLNNTKLIVKVYYETLCPASVDFFVTQLQPIVESLSSYVEIVMIPYGHAETRYIHGTYKFRCQHGPAECHGNKLHSCAIDVIKNKTNAVLFNACLMQYSAYSGGIGAGFATVFNWCGYKLRVNLKAIWSCLTGGRGTTLLKRYGEETQKLRPSYVPFIVVDGSSEAEDKASNNLMATVCRLLPAPPPPCAVYLYRRSQ